MEKIYLKYDDIRHRFYSSSLMEELGFEVKDKERYKETEPVNIYTPITISSK